AGTSGSPLLGCTPRIQARPWGENRRDRGGSPAYSRFSCWSLRPAAQPLRHRHRRGAEGESPAVGRVAATGGRATRRKTTITANAGRLGSRVAREASASTPRTLAVVRTMGRNARLRCLALRLGPRRVRPAERVRAGLSGPGHVALSSNVLPARLPRAGLPGGPQHTRAAGGARGGGATRGRRLGGRDLARPALRLFDRGVGPRRAHVRVK